MYMIGLTEVENTSLHINRSFTLKVQQFIFVSLLLIFLFPSLSFSACIEGDCENGTGTYEYHIGKKYVGEWRDSKKHGYGTYTYPDGTQYIGEFQNNKKNGQGLETYPDGSKYEGEFRKNKPNGLGTFTTAKGESVYGEFKDGELVKPSPPPEAPQPVMDDASGESDTGEDTIAASKGDEAEQQQPDVIDVADTPEVEAIAEPPGESGKVSLSSEGRYVGEEKDGVPHGRGTLEKEDGSTYVGEFRAGKPNGQGIITFANGEKYVGEFKDGNPHGQGVITFADGKKFTGEFKDGKPDGPGIITNIDGKQSVLEFKEGKPVLAE